MTTNKLLILSLLSPFGASLGACGGDEPCDPTAPNTVCTIAGSNQQGYKGDNGPATAAALYIPQDTVMAPDGELWILDFNNYVIRAIDAAGDIRTIIGTGEIGDSPDPEIPEMPALDARLNHTPDMLFHDGYLYLAAWHNSRIKRVRLDAMMIENFAGAGKRMFYDGDGGPAKDAALDLPSSIAIDPSGNVVIMDQANQVIRRVDETGTIDTIVGTCVVESDFPCAPGVAPVACPDSHKLACVPERPATARMAFTDMLAEECSKPCTPSYGGDGGLALDARMGQPFGQAADPAGRLAYDSRGNLIFADTDNNRIRMVDTSGIITTIAGTGQAGYSGDDGPAAQAKVNRPVDIEIAPDDTIYFTDVYNNCVRKIDPSGTISRVAGLCGPEHRGFAGDGGSPLQARFDRPYGIELSGNQLYVTDSYNDRIRVVNLP
jgi:sugar lactone lactonase YvrE